MAGVPEATEVISVADRHQMTEQRTDVELCAGRGIGELRGGDAGDGVAGEPGGDEEVGTRVGRGRERSASVVVVVVMS